MERYFYHSYYCNSQSKGWVQSTRRMDHSWIELANFYSLYGDHLGSLRQWQEPTSTQRSSALQCLAVPEDLRNTFAGPAFSCAALKIWNRFQRDVIGTFELNSVAKYSFKSYLKRQLYKLSSPNNHPEYTSRTLELHIWARKKYVY